MVSLRKMAPFRQLLATTTAARVRDVVKAPAYMRPAFRTPGLISAVEAELLYRLASEVTEGCIVEVGSFRGRSTIVLALGARAGSNPRVYAVEPHEAFVGELGGRFGPEDRAAFFRAMLRSGCYDNVRLVNLSTEVVTPGWRAPVGLLWIDGDHSIEAVARDFDGWAPYLTSPAVVALDDSDRHSGPLVLIDRLLGAGLAERTEVVEGITVLRLDKPAVAADRLRGA